MLRRASENDGDHAHSVFTKSQCKSWVGLKVQACDPRIQKAEAGGLGTLKSVYIAIPCPRKREEERSRKRRKEGKEGRKREEKLLPVQLYREVEDDTSAKSSFSWLVRWLSSKLF